ncbi:MAG: hypothetical protein O2807_13145 [bacterium]|nr:hypothetical protein [bacterium]
MEILLAVTSVTFVVGFSLALPYLSWKLAESAIPLARDYRHPVNAEGNRPLGQLNRLPEEEAAEPMRKAA